MPFYLVMIPPHKYGKRGTDQTLCENIWMAQYRAAREIENCEIVPVHDSIEKLDLHPKNKEAVGLRLAEMALSKAYGRPLPSSGPVFKSASLKNGRIEVAFDKVDRGLVTRDGKDPSHFELSEDGQSFILAAAKIQGDKVIVYSEEIKNPRFVRMGWSDAYNPNLGDKNGWPAYQFPAMPVK